MKNKNILVTILLTASTLAFTACGNTATTASAAGAAKNNQVVENATTAESETAVQESTTKNNAVKENKEATAETAVVEQNETAESADSKIEFNGAGHKGTLQETEQTYITYTDLDPTLMYVISATSTYHDLNVTEGELVVSGLLDANQELLIDGKGTFNNVDYYRIAFQEAMMLNHQIIIPAEFVVAELQEQETPAVETPAPEVQQQPTQQQPTTPDLPTGNTEAPEWTPDTGVSKEDWDAFFGGGNTTGQRTWEPDGNDNMTIDENGNIWDPDIDMDKVGSLTFH